MFKNLIVYRLTAPWPVGLGEVEAALQKALFLECGATQEKKLIHDLVVALGGEGRTAQAA